MKIDERFNFKTAIQTGHVDNVHFGALQKFSTNRSHVFHFLRSIHKDDANRFNAHTSLPVFDLTLLKQKKNIILYRPMLFQCVEMFNYKIQIAYINVCANGGQTEHHVVQTFSDQK